MLSFGKLVLNEIRSLDAYKALKQASDSCKITMAYGLDELPSAVMIGALESDSVNKAILVCENEILARRQAEDINALGVSAAALPGSEISFLKADASSREISLQRLRIMGDFVMGKIRVLVLPAEAIMNWYMPRSKFEAGFLKVHTGDIIGPEALIKALTGSGYERVDLVEGRGQCALRGGIVDVYPVGAANAVRIEFFDDEIDQIREFDILTQRSLGQLDTICVYPARELFLSEIEAKEAAAHIMDCLNHADPDESLDRQRSIEKEFDLLPYEEFFALTKPEDDLSDELPSMWDLGVKEREPRKTVRARKASTQMEKQYFPIVDSLENGRVFDGGSALTRLLCKQSVSIFDFAKEARVYIQQSDRIRERCKGLMDDFLLNYKAAFERGEVLKEQVDALIGYDALVGDIKKHPVICLESFLRTQTDYPPEKLVKIECIGAPGFGGNIHELSKNLALLQEKLATIMLLSGGSARGKRLSKSLDEEGIVAPYYEEIPDTLEKGIPSILPANLSGGFIFAEIGLYVFCEDDIFGKGNKRKRASSANEKKVSSFTELRVGDYVVHENHGIGQYLGTVRMMIDGTSRDFLNIRYGGTDKLYVPTDQMDRIQKYIGSEGEEPKLNRLSGGEWQKQKSKVKRAIKEIAGDLIKLYAERSAAAGYAFSRDTPWQKEFEDSFPFEETPDQIRAIEEIKADMEKPLVMDRLLCGDVGYGKTEVALRAIFKCVMEGKQAVLLAPTTILVQQHYATALNRFANFPVNIETLSRFRTQAEQKEVIRKLKTGEVDFVIGTHKLLSSGIEYKDLGLLVVDEEQRFGVGHKEKIKQYKKSVDVLTLSATPIPRTLHMSMVGIRDMSILKTPPEERFPVQTYVVEYSDGLVRDAILRELSRGGQVYVLHNRVQSIDMMYNRLKKLVPEARIAVGHGQMREQQLEDVMLDFYDRKFDVLLCSTIIEAGLDVPYANTLIVCDSDRFGLSQLYQLRGRVGRSNRVAYAYLTVSPSKVLTADAEKRLSAIRDFTEFGSGFRVAMRDLEIRGTGNLLGAEQSGHMAAVGYDLYVKMINETVAEMQGNEAPTPIQTRIELNIDAYLPSDYIEADSMRIEMYKRIAEVKDEESQNDVIDELLDRFGDPAKPVMNLIAIARIKAACEKLGIDQLSFKDGSLVMHFSDEAQLDITRFLTAVQKEKHFKFVPQRTGNGTLLYKDPNLNVEKLLTPCTAALTDLANAVFVREDASNE